MTIGAVKGRYFTKFLVYLSVILLGITAGAALARAHGANFGWTVGTFKWYSPAAHNEPWWWDLQHGMTYDFNLKTAATSDGVADFTFNAMRLDSATAIPSDAIFYDHAYFYGSGGSGNKTIYEYQCYLLDGFANTIYPAFGWTNMEEPQIASAKVYIRGGDSTCVYASTWANWDQNDHQQGL